MSLDTTIKIKKEKGFSVEVKLTGFEKVNNNLFKLKKKGREAAQKFLKAEAQKLRKASMARTPVKTGALQASTRVLSFGSTGRRQLSISVVVGGVVRKGKFVGYAAKVHEDHPTKSKFLATALTLLKPGMAKRLQEVINRELKLQRKRV